MSVDDRLKEMVEGLFKQYDLDKNQKLDAE